MTTVTEQADLRGDPKRRARERRVRFFFVGSAVVSIIISLLIIGSLAGESWNFLTTVDLGSLWEIGWFPRRGLFDLRTIIVATLLITVIAMVIAAPLGLGAAIYLSEYASP